MPRHSFLEDLSAEITLTTNLLAEPVRGRELVLRVIKAAGSLYTSQGGPAPVRLPDGRMLIEYAAELTGGGRMQAVVVAEWQGQEVTRLSILFAPLTPALAFALRVGDLLSQP